MQIVEIFGSRQGEGLWTGTVSTFVRVGGCHLRCRFCDTPYTWGEPTEGENLSVEEILGRVLLLGHEHVVLTGGEPMLFPEMVPLTKQLESQGYTITIETAGTSDLPVRCHLMSISPKFSNSTPLEADENTIRRHEENRNHPEVVRAFMERYNYQLKFVIDVPSDLEETEIFLKQFSDVAPDRVFFMPQGVTEEELKSREPWITDYCKNHGYLYCPRMQIIWYGNKRRT